MLDCDVQRVSGKVLSVFDTGIMIPIMSTSTFESQYNMSLSMENICGTFPGLFENNPSAGGLLLPDAPAIARIIKHRQFVGTHQLFHTIHGRIMFQPKKKKWTFKGTRSLEDMVDLVRGLTNDYESAIFPAVHMLSVTLRTEISLIIDPAHSLLARVIAVLYSNVLSTQTRMDDTNNLYFMDVVSWKELLRIVENGNVGCTDVGFVRAYLATLESDPGAVPTASIGYTRNGIFFIRITFPRGCVCNVKASRGTGPVSDKVCVGGLEPFVNVLVQFIMEILVKMRVVGTAYENT
jgi:hypothetical protein